MNDGKKYFLTAISNKAVSIGMTLIQPNSKPVMFTEADFNANKDAIEYHVRRKNIAVIAPGDKSYNTLVKRMEAMMEMESKMPKFVPPPTLKISTPLGRYSPLTTLDTGTEQCIAFSTTMGRRCERKAVEGNLCKIHAKLVKSNKEVFDYLGNPIIM